MGSPLRVRSRHDLGYGPFGSFCQHGYELAHMVLESEEIVDGTNIVWTDDLMHRYFDLVLPAVQYVERICYRFSEQFSYRMSWSSCSGEKFCFSLLSLFLYFQS